MKTVLIVGGIGALLAAGLITTAVVVRKRRTAGFAGGAAQSLSPAPLFVGPNGDMAFGAGIIQHSDAFRQSRMQAAAAVQAQNPGRRTVEVRAPGG